jgi:Tfp pilus assembly protein PilN
MWHNLLSENTFARLNRERKGRLVAVACLTVASAAVVGIVALVPAAVVVWGREASIRALESVHGKQTDETLAIAEYALQRARKPKTAQDAAATGKGVVSFADMLWQAVPSGVRLERVALQPSTQGSSLQGSIAGTAATRESLRAFEEALRALPSMREVRVPLDAYAARTDLEFTLSFLYALSER